MWDDLGNYIYDGCRNIVIGLYSAVVAVIAPIDHILIWLFILYVINCMYGYKAGAKLNGERFSMKKIYNGLKLLVAYFLLIILGNRSMSIVGQETHAMILVNIISAWFMLFYLINIVKSVSQLHPESEAIRVLYKVLTVDVKYFILRKVDDKLKK